VDNRHVTVDGLRLLFAAAHMATLGAELEPLHGHNYSVRCRVEGALTDDAWVIDFSALKRYTREACEQLDHRFLLQEHSKLLEIDHDGSYYLIRFGEREYRFPESDVAALPIENTTAELIAEWLMRTIAASLRAHAHENIAVIAVDVEEMPGQAAGARAELASLAE
jgi:6-pyruvoyltetrahydropterin/6-carboxytetrahydropterin synthase